jgi:hypothetical protein
VLCGDHFLPFLMSQKEPQDLSSSERSSLVYNTRSVKIHQIKPFRGNLDQENRDPTLPKRTAIDSHDEVVTHHSEYHPSSQIADPQLQKVPPKNHRRLFAKLNSLLSGRIERTEQAQELTSILKKLRRQNTIEEIIRNHLEEKFLFPLVSSCDFFLKFEFLVEEVLSFILPLIRHEEYRQVVFDDILSSGALIFCFSTLRQHLTNPNIRTLAVDLLASSIDFIVDIANENLSKFKDKKYASHSFVTHELVLHGGTTFLPSLLTSFLDSHSEIGSRRVLKCWSPSQPPSDDLTSDILGIKFLLLRSTFQVAQSLASCNHFALLRGCIAALKRFSIEAQRDAAIILTGYAAPDYIHIPSLVLRRLSASSLIISEKLVELNGWDDVRTVLANPSLDFSGTRLSLPSSIVLWII